MSFGVDSDPPRNRILAALPPADWKALQDHASYLVLPAGETIKGPGDSASSLYFPDTGVVSVVSTLKSGHQVEVAAFGADGFVGSTTVLSGLPSPCWTVIQLDSTGHRIPLEPFRSKFEELPALRRLVLAHVGRLLRDMTRSAACNRFHTSRQRLARWLLVTVDKSESRSLHLTHDFIAQMVGGPRHAVTQALTALRDDAAIDAERGRIEVLDIDRLASHACECYEPEP